MNQFKIVGIAIKDRIKEASKTQAVLSKYANIISARMGFHEVNEFTCSRIGFIVLQVIYNKELYPHFIQELKEIGGIEVQEMNFNL